MNEQSPYFNQQPKRKAEFIKPPNIIKMKVGSGGLSEEILGKAQALLEENNADFRPLGEMYLDTMMKGIEQARTPSASFDNETVIAGIIYPAMQLKANGGMFKYPLVTRMADKLIHYLEVIETVDEEALEIILAFHTTLRAVLLSRIQGEGGQKGAELMMALNDACFRYFEKNPHNRSYDMNEKF